MGSIDPRLLYDRDEIKEQFPMLGDKRLRRMEAAGLPFRVIEDCEDTKRAGTKLYRGCDIKAALWHGLGKESKPGLRFGDWARSQERKG